MQNLRNCCGRNKLKDLKGERANYLRRREAWNADFLDQVVRNYLAAVKRIGQGGKSVKAAVHIIICSVKGCKTWPPQKNLTKCMYVLTLLLKIRLCFNILGQKWASCSVLREEKLNFVLAFIPKNFLPFHRKAYRMEHDVQTQVSKSPPNSSLSSQLSDESSARL